MTPASLKATLAALGITERGLSRALGVEEKSVRRWTRGERPIHAGLALLLTLALDLPPLAERLAALSAPVGKTRSPSPAALRIKRKLA